MNFEYILLFNLSFTYHCVTPNNRCNFCAGVLLNIQSYIHSFVHSFIQSCKARVLCVLKKYWWDIFTLILRIKKNMLVFDDAIILHKHTQATVPTLGVRCSSVVREFTHGAMGRRIDPSWGGPFELFLVPASAPRLV